MFTTFDVIKDRVLFMNIDHVCNLILKQCISTVQSVPIIEEKDIDLMFNQYTNIMYGLPFVQINNIFLESKKKVFVIFQLFVTFLSLMHQSIESLGGGGRDLAGKHGASAKYCLK